MKPLVRVSFEPSWTLENKVTIQVDDDGRRVLLTCRKISQISSMASPEDTSDRENSSIQWEKNVTRSFFYDLFSILEDQHVPVVPIFPDGLDGALYKLELNIRGYPSSFTWWSAPPPGYEPLSEFVGHLLDVSEHEKQPHI